MLPLSLAIMNVVGEDTDAKITLMDYLLYNSVDLDIGNPCCLFCQEPGSHDDRLFTMHGEHSHIHCGYRAGLISEAEAYMFEFEHGILDYNS